MRGRRLWMKLEAHGGTIPVYVQRGELKDDEGNDVDAYYEKDKPEIVIKHSDNAAGMKMKLHHELLHVCFGSHSGDAKAFLGSTYDARGKREEDIVSFLEPIQFDLLVRNGWLRYPNPPRWK